MTINSLSCNISYSKLLSEFWDNIKRGVDNTANARQRFIEGLLDLAGCLWGVVRRGLAAPENCRGYCVAGVECVTVDAGLEYRGRPGSGQPPPPLELGVVLHPVFLVPYYPGSSVKGAMRSLLLARLAEMLAGEYGVGEGDAWSEAGRCVEPFFGRGSTGFPGFVGGVTVFDAYPVEPGVGGLVLVGDVLTPHYRGPRGPVRFEHEAQPRPVVGVSVAEGTVFRFRALVDVEAIREELSRARCRDELRDMLGRDPAGLVVQLLVEALTVAGVGGKTARGYGFFMVRRLEREGCRPRAGRRCAGRR